MKKNTFVLTAALALVLVLLAVPASAQTRVQMLPAGAGDLAAAEIAAPMVSKSAPAVPREAITFSRELAADAELAMPAPHVSLSRAYWVDVTGAELAAGVPLYSLGESPLVRLNPADTFNKAGVTPEAVEILAGGRVLKAGNGIDRLVTADQLAAAGMPFPAGTVAFRLAAGLGDDVRVRVEGLPSEARYVMDVLDASSDVEMSLRTLRSTYLDGQTLVVEASLPNAEVRSMNGFVTSPAGRAWPLTFKAAADGTFRAHLRLDANEPLTPGLWEVHAAADGHAGGQALLRNARTAFAAAVPAARLTGTAELAEDAGLRVRLGVRAAASGRYEVSGVLYGTAADGTLRPAGLGQSAAWRDAGQGTLDLVFSADVLAANGLAAPFEVRDLQLKDQGRMALIHRQARGLVIE